MNTNNIEALDLNLLKVFVSVYEGKSATVAAERLNITQSAVSASLAKLRRIFEDPLFVRTGRGLTPTLLAHQIYPFHRDALDDLIASLQLHGEGDPKLSGRTVILGMSDDFEMALAPTLLDIAAGIQGCSRLHFSQTYSGAIAEMLLSRTIDIGITVGGYTRDGISSFDIGQGTYGCLLDPKVHGELPELTLDYILHHEHIMVSRGGFFGIVDDVLANLGLQRKVHSSTSHFCAVPFLLTGTNCLTILPMHAAQRISEISRLKCYVCPMEVPRYTISLIWRTHSRSDIVMKQLLTAFKQQLPEKIKAINKAAHPASFRVAIS